VIATSMPRAILAHVKRSPLSTVTQSWSPLDTVRPRHCKVAPMDEVMHRAVVQEGEQAFALDHDVDHHAVLCLQTYHNM
jgi:ureidoglycolate hydrolase